MNDNQKDNDPNEPYKFYKEEIKKQNNIKKGGIIDGRCYSTNCFGLDCWTCPKINVHATQKPQKMYR